MKRALLATVLALVSMIGALPAQTATADVVPAACGEERAGIRDFPKDLDSHRFVNLRSISRVGVAGVIFTGVQAHGEASDFNPCA